ncbi:serine protease [Cryobacterium sp. Hh11]|nr:serine protease [Cryobacterium sp. Hh11]
MPLPRMGVAVPWCAASLLMEYVGVSVREATPVNHAPSALLRRCTAAIIIPLLVLAGIVLPTSTFTAQAASPAAMLAASAQGAAMAADPADPRQSVIVQAASSAAGVALAEAQSRAGVRIDNRYRAAFAGFSAELTAAQIAHLRSSPLVERVELDTATHIDTLQPDAPWGLDRIDQHSSALSGTYDYGTSGAGVTVYVIDSGIRLTHTEFGGRATSGYDFVDDDSDASDCNGHGTHVSGTIGGTTYGIAKSVSMVALRVFDCGGSGYVSDLIAAVDWVVTYRSGPSVINISGGGESNALLDEAVENASAAGVPVVVAAGNRSQDSCGTASPAETPAAITVGATDAGDYRASYSNFGECVDLFAPGSGVRSSFIGSDTDNTLMSGTSMAAPHVTGAVARYLQVNASSTPAQIDDFLSAQATQGVVFDARSTSNYLLYVSPGNSDVSLGNSDVTPPTVTSRVPVVNARSISQTANISATFSEPVINVTASSFSLRSKTATVAAAVTYASGTNVATLNPSSTLAADTLYTVTVTGVRDIAGNVIAGTSWSFQSGPAPTIIAAVPRTDARAISRTANVTVTFSEPVTKVSTTTITMKTGTTLVPAAVTYDATTRTATLNPTATLGADRLFSVNVAGLLDAVGNPLVPTSWSFTSGPVPTITSVSPASGATSVRRAANATATFSEAIIGVSASTVKLTNASTGTVITAVRSFNSTTKVLTINPSVTLASNTLYRVTITGGTSAVRDAAGNPLATKTWTFRTGSSI